MSDTLLQPQQSMQTQAVEADETASNNQKKHHEWWGTASDEFLDSKKPRTKFVLALFLISVVLVIVGVLVYLSRSQFFNSTSTEEIVESSTPVSDSSVNTLSEESTLPDQAESSTELPFDMTDTDLDGIPDWVETEIGTDPQIAECSSLLQDCGTVDSLDATHRFGDNLVLIMDFSGSMNADIGNGQTRLEVAKAALNNYISDLNIGNTRFGFIAYGHTGDNSTASKDLSCNSAEVVYPLGQLDKSNVQNLINSTQARGWTPIEKSLDTAITELKRLPNYATQRSTIVLITDGEETCDGDPVSKAKQIRGSGIDVVIDVIALGADTALTNKLQPIAESGGGEFYSVEDEVSSWNDLYTKFSEISTQSNRAVACGLTVWSEVMKCTVDVKNNHFWPYTRTFETEDPQRQFLYRSPELGYSVYHAFESYIQETLKPVTEQQQENFERGQDARDTYLEQTNGN